MNTIAQSEPATRRSGEPRIMAGRRNARTTHLARHDRERLRQLMLEELARSEMGLHDKVARSKIDAVLLRASRRMISERVNALR